MAAHGLTRAREGRGFLGLGTPVDDSGITDDVAHAGATWLAFELLKCFGVGIGSICVGNENENGNSGPQQVRDEHGVGAVGISRDRAEAELWG